MLNTWRALQSPNKSRSLFPVLAVSCSHGIPQNPDAHSLRLASRHLWQEQFPGRGGRGALQVGLWPHPAELLSPESEGKKKNTHTHAHKAALSTAGIFSSNNSRLFCGQPVHFPGVYLSWLYHMHCSLHKGILEPQYGFWIWCSCDIYPNPNISDYTHSCTIKWPRRDETSHTFLATDRPQRRSALGFILFCKKLALALSTITTSIQQTISIKYFVHFVILSSNG